MIGSGRTRPPDLRETNQKLLEPRRANTINNANKINVDLVFPVSKEQNKATHSTQLPWFGVLVRVFWFWGCCFKSSGLGAPPGRSGAAVAAQAA